MANDIDPVGSPTAFSPSMRASPSSNASSQPTSPATSTGHDDGLARLKSSTAVGAAASAKPRLTVSTGDPRRTQSASDLSLQKAVSPATSDPATSDSSSPRISLTESLSRSSSFLAAAFNSGNISLFSGVSSPSSRSEHLRTVTVVYADPGPLYVDLYSRADGRGAFVKSFRRRADGTMGNAEACGNVRVNDMLYSINDLVVTELLFASIIHAAKTTTFPCTLVFHSRLPAPIPPSPTTASASASPAKASNGTTWSTKLGQMIGETGIKRSASFERRPFTDSASSPVRRPSLSASSPNTLATSGSPSETPGKSKPWGDSIEKVKNSDGVKNLLRLMAGGNSKARPEDDRETVDAWFTHLELRFEDSRRDIDEGYLASPLVVAASCAGGRLLGVSEEDWNDFVFTWYRKTASQDLIQIKGVRAGLYNPSVDDVDARISVRCQSLRFPDLVRVVEFGPPLVVDPAVKEMVDILLEAGAGTFSATLASNEHDTFQIKITEDRVTLLKISEEEDEGGVVVNADYHVYLQVLVDPCDQLRFTLKVRELGSMLGSRVGDMCDVRKKHQLAGVSCYFLIAQNPQHRDILALLIRRFRARKVIKEEEDIAHRDELNLFVDPASSLHCVAVSPTEEANGAVGRRSYITPISQGDLRRASPHRSDVQELPDASPDKLADFFTLDSDMTTLSRGANVTGPQQPSSGTASFTNPASARSSLGNGPDTSGRNNFTQDRLVAQEKEIAMLQEKLASMSVLVKSNEHEKYELTASLEMKDNRIESQQMRLHQLERANVQLATACRELQQVRARLSEETKLHQACQQQLAKAIEERDDAELQERCSQTDNQVEIPESYRLAMEESQAQVGFLTSEIAELRQKVMLSQKELQKLEQEHLKTIAERNALRSRSVELAKELKTIVGSHRSLADVQAQLQERTHLATQLAVARAEAKRVADEMQEYKDALDGVVKQQQQSGAADKDKAATQRLVSQNTELQRLVHQLTDSLHETREQMAAMKKINSVLVAKMQHENPELRGSILESPSMSPMSTTSSVHDPRFSDDEDEEEDDDQGHDSNMESKQKVPQVPPSPKTSAVVSDDFHGGRQ